MRATHREIRSYSQRRTSDVDVKAAAAACRIRTVELTPDFAKLRCGFNFWSFGENIEIYLSEVNGDLLIDVRSACASPTQIEDWGKNRKNIRRLFDALESQLGTCGGRSVTTCGKCGYLLAGINADRCPECGSVPGQIPVSGTFRQRLSSGLRMAIVFSAVEITVVFFLRQFVTLPSLFMQFAGLGGAFFLIFVNTFVILSLLLLGSVWRPNR